VNHNKLTGYNLV